MQPDDLKTSNHGNINDTFQRPPTQHTWKTQECCNKRNKRGGRQLYLQALETNTRNWIEIWILDCQNQQLKIGKKAVFLNQQQNFVLLSPYY